MNRRFAILILGLVLLVATGCFEVNLRVKVFENGEGMLNHTVSVPTTAYHMQRMSGQPDEVSAEQRLLDLAEQDAAHIGGLELAKVSVREEVGITYLARMFLFRDAEALAEYLNLLGLTAELKRRQTLFCHRLKGYDFSLSAPGLDRNKLLRLGQAAARFNQPGSQAAVPGMPQGGLTVEVDLPGNAGLVEPEAPRDAGFVTWVVKSEQFNQPLQLLLNTRAPKRKPVAAGEPRPFGGATLDVALTGLFDADYSRRLGQRAFPVLHVRLDKRGRADLAVLWVDDQLVQNMSAYHRRLDGLLLPEFAANYYEWMELVELDGETHLAAGYRLRRPLRANKLAGALNVAKKNGRYQVAFQPPAVFANLSEANVPPEQRVAVLAVTFPDGSRGQAVLSMGDLRAGNAVTVREGE